MIATVQSSVVKKLPLIASFVPNGFETISARRKKPVICPSKLFLPLDQKVAVSPLADREGSLPPLLLVPLQPSCTCLGLQRASVTQSLALTEPDILRQWVNHCPGCSFALTMLSISLGIRQRFHPASEWFHQSVQTSIC